MDCLSSGPSRRSRSSWRTEPDCACPTSIPPKLYSVRGFRYPQDGMWQVFMSRSCAMIGDFSRHERSCLRRIKPRRTARTIVIVPIPQELLSTSIRIVCPAVMGMKSSPRCALTCRSCRWGCRCSFQLPPRKKLWRGTSAPCASRSRGTRPSTRSRLIWSWGMSGWIVCPPARLGRRVAGTSRR